MFIVEPIPTVANPASPASVLSSDWCNIIQGDNDHGGLNLL